MLYAALVLAAVACVRAVVLVGRARLQAAERLLAENRAEVERERIEWRLDRAALEEAQLKEREAWRHERAGLLNRIQAPQVAVMEAYAEADEYERTQARDGTRPVRELRHESEHADAMAEHVAQAKARLASLGIDDDELAAAAAAHGDDVAR